MKAQSRCDIAFRGILVKTMVTLISFKVSGGQRMLKMHCLRSVSRDERILT